MAERLWAPWRIEYIRQPKRTTGCVLCSYAESERSPDTGVLAHWPEAYVVLNKYPYSAAHLMVVPRRHTGDLELLTADEHAALWRLTREALLRLRRATGAQGVNLGMNLGSAAGAGIDEHLHAHLVPRWVGDHNFMPVIADTAVMPQYLEATWAQLAPEFADLSRDPA
jgi:ATP adenylyltransferase